MRKRFLVCSAKSFGEPFWQPSADVCRLQKGWLIKMDLAGVRLEDIQISRKQNCLTIEGIRRDLQEEESAAYYSLEISYNRFKRIIQLPVELEEAEMNLSYRDGMLLIRVQQGG
jgi:HSP20 family protein